jgi:hypothetical protein
MGGRVLGQDQTGENRATIHPDARSRFDELGVQLVRSIVALPKSVGNSAPPRFKPDTVTSQTVTEDDIIGDVHLGFGNAAGEPTGQAFVREDGCRVGLFGDGYRALVDLAQGMQRVCPFNGLATRSFLEEELFSWVKATVRSETTSTPVDWLLDRLEAEVKTCEVVIPISELHLESELILGPVALRTFPKHFFEQFEAPGTAGEEAQREAHATWCRQMREQFQGLAAAHVRITAEPKRAIELAYEHVDLAVGVLRFFAPPHFEPRFVSHLAPFSLAPARKLWTFVAGEDGRCFKIFDRLVDPQPPSVVDDAAKNLMLSLGLADLQRILAKDVRSAFDDAILSALVMFGRAALTWDLRERLVWYCASLESILLRADSESIVQNLSERLALVTYDARESRQRAIDDIRRVYNIRSRFVHHGSDIDDGNLVKVFANHGFRFFQRALKLASKFEEKNAFVSHIDSIKLSGQAAL